MSDAETPFGEIPDSWPAGELPGGANKPDDGGVEYDGVAYAMPEDSQYMGAGDPLAFEYSRFTHAFSDFVQGVVVPLHKMRAEVRPPHHVPEDTRLFKLYEFQGGMFERWQARIELLERAAADALAEDLKDRDACEDREPEDDAN